MKFHPHLVLECFQIQPQFPRCHYLILSIEKCKRIQFTVRQKCISATANSLRCSGYEGPRFQYPGQMRHALINPVRGFKAGCRYWNSLLAARNLRNFAETAGWIQSMPRLVLKNHEFKLKYTCNYSLVKFEIWVKKKIYIYTNKSYGH